MKLLFLLFLTLCGAYGLERYDNYKVYRIQANTYAQKEILLNLQNSPDLDFWSDVNNLGLPVDVMVKPKDQTMFERILMLNGMKSDVYIHDVQKLVENEDLGKYDKKSGRFMTWTQYYTLPEIHQWLDDMAAENPGVVTVIEAGRSYQDRPLKGVKISFGTGKRSVFVEGGIHAREWVSPATLTYLINDLVTSTDPSIRKIAESLDWYIFPVVNPDGFVFTHTNTRLWRKTRAPYSACIGVDANRNFDAHWMEQGSSNNPCADTFAGPTPFSEVETIGLSNFISGIADTMDVYISFHSYSQLMLLPYGHTTQPLDNYNEMMQIGRAAATALQQRYGTRYSVGNIAEIIYPASGGSIDWVKQEFKTPVVLAYELRDTGAFGFLLPANQILPNCLEVMDSLVALLEESEKFGYVTLN